jgi:hypothetical protein
LNEKKRKIDEFGQYMFNIVNTDIEGEYYERADKCRKTLADLFRLFGDNCDMDYEVEIRSLIVNTG